MICARARLKRTVNLLRTMTDGQTNIFHVRKLTHGTFECKLNAVFTFEQPTPLTREPEEQRHEEGRLYYTLFCILCDLCR